MSEGDWKEVGRLNIAILAVDTNQNVRLVLMMVWQYVLANVPYHNRCCRMKYVPYSRMTHRTIPPTDLYWDDTQVGTVACTVQYVPYDDIPVYISGGGPVNDGYSTVVPLCTVLVARVYWRFCSSTDSEASSTLG
jgi:hypothetical protein